LPFLPYYQLLSNVDTFIFLDDVNLNKTSFINRNRIVLTTNEILPFNLPIKNKSQNRKICEHCYHDSYWDESWMRISNIAKRKASDSQSIALTLLSLVEELRQSKLRNVAEFNIMSLLKFLDYAGAKTPHIMRSSLLRKFLGDNLAGVNAILALCSLVKADRYINPAGGVSLYMPHYNHFLEKNIDLHFVDIEQCLSKLSHADAASSVLAPFISCSDNVFNDSLQLFTRSAREYL